jgi:hypothetical protein
MGQTVDQIEARIQQARQRVSADLHELEAKVDSATNWRTHVNRQPYMWLGAAFVAGFVLSGPNGRGTGRVGRALRAETGTHTFDRFVGALTAIAVERAKNYVDGRLPGFGREFDRVG